MTNFVPFERRSFSGAAADTTLASSLDGTSLTVSVTDATGWPDGSAGRFIVILEPDTSAEEKCLGLSRTGNTITLAQRGLEGSAAAHTGTTSVVRHGGSAIDFDEANHAVAQTIGQIAAKGDLLVGSGANALTVVSKGATGQVPIWQSDGSVAAGVPAPAAHTHAEADVTALTTDLAGKMAAPATAWAKGSLVVGTGAGTFDTLAVGTTGQVPTVQASGALAYAAPSNGPLAVVSYNPPTAQSWTIQGSTSMSSMVALDTTNLKVTFTAPASGRVLIRLTGVVNENVYVFWGVRNGSTDLASSPISTSSDSTLHASVALLLTGLSGSQTLYWSAAAWTNSVPPVLAAGGTGYTSTTYGPAVIEVWAS